MNPLREKLNSGRGLAYIGAPSALAAKEIERQGGDGIYLSGAVLSQFVHGIADDGTVTLEQLATFAGTLCGATTLPVIADADTGFTENTDVSHCIRALIEAGVAGVQMEDQVPAKKCGHLDGKTLIPAGEMAEKIRSAVEARRDTGLVLIARTDARGVTGWDDALERAHQYREAGADMIFIEALGSAREFQDFGEACPGPLLANMTEFGKSPLLSRSQLASWGYTVVIYPATLMRVMMPAAEQAIATILKEGHQKPLVDSMWSRGRLYDLIGYDHSLPAPPEENES